MGCKGGRVSNIPKVVKMCSITNTAHHPHDGKPVCVCGVVCVVLCVMVCEHSSVLTDLRRRGACNQGKKA